MQAFPVSNSSRASSATIRKRRATAQVLGVTGLDDDGEAIGLSGVEMGLDAKLKTASRARASPSSIDMRVQYILAHEVAASRAEFSAKQAGGLVLDVRTGEVLAMVYRCPISIPMRAASVPATARTISSARTSSSSARCSRSSRSTLATEDHTMRPDEVFPIGNGYKIGRFTIHEAEHMPASLAARDILALSSNIGTTQIALRSGPERQHAFLEHMGILSALQHRTAEARRPLYPSHWGQIETRR